jgi:hypothetical protein
MKENITREAETMMTTQILQLKNTVTELKCSLEGHNHKKRD